MAETNSQEQEQQVKKLKRQLEGWRMAVVPLKSVILWEQQWHPAAIIATVTILHLIIWMLDFNFLTTFAVLGLIVNFVDFIVPVICNSIYSPNTWTGQKEKMFEEICRTIVAHYNNIVNQFQGFCSLRQSSPCLYYIISIGMLCVLAWVSSTINNIFLLYILSTVTLLWPGIQHRGILNTLMSSFNMLPKTLKSE